MNRELTPAEKKAMDSLLKEAVGNAQPPDLSTQILDRFHGGVDDSSPIVCVDDRSFHQQGSVTPKQIGMVLGLITALAASFMMAIWLRPDAQEPSADSSIAGIDSPESTAAESPATPTPEIAAPSHTTESSPASKPPRGIPLEIDYRNLRLFNKIKRCKA